MKRHVAYLQRMAQGARQGAQAARDESRFEEDHLGGRTPDHHLRSLVTHLFTAHQEILGIRPLHTINPDNGRADRGVAAFVKKALKQFAPERVFKDRVIDELVRRSLPLRDEPYFEPPAIP